MKKLSFTTFTFILLFFVSCTYASVKISINKQTSPSSGDYFLIIMEVKDNVSYLDHLFGDLRFMNGVRDVVISKKYDWDRINVYKKGDQIYHKDGYTFSSNYILVSAEADYYSSQDLRFEVKVYPDISGTIDFQYRGTRCKVVGTTYTTVQVDPTSGTKDEQGWYVKKGSQLHDGSESKPDVISRDIIVNDGNPVYENTLVVIKATGEEINNKSAGSINFGLYIDDIFDNQYFTAKLSDGDDDPLSFTHTFSKGRHKVEVIADYDKNLSEENENNNSTSVYIDVIFVNQNPIITPIGAKSVNEGQLLSFTVITSDPDGDPVTVTTSALPQGATFVSNVFSWTPTSTQSGSYSVTFTASDGKGGIVSEVVSITVVDINNDDVILTYPNGGEQLIAKNKYRITWNATIVPQTIKIFFSKNSGGQNGNWQEIYSASNPQVNYYDWDVPDPSAYRCRIKIIAVMNGKEYFDESDKDFFVLGTITYASFIPLSGTKAQINLLPDTESNMCVVVGKEQGIQSFSLQIDANNVNDKFNVSIIKPNGETAFTGDVVGSFKKVFSSPEPGTWKAKTIGLLTTGNVVTDVSFVMTNPSIGFPLLAIKYPEQAWRYSVGFVTGTCNDDDDWWCVVGDLTGIVPALGIASDVLKMFSSAILGTIAYFSNDPETHNRTEKYFTTTGLSFGGVILGCFGVSFADEAVKHWDDAVKIAEFGKNLDHVGTLGPEATRFLEGSRGSVIRITAETVYFLEKMSKEVKVGIQYEYKTLLLGLFHSDGVYETGEVLVKIDAGKDAGKIISAVGKNSEKGKDLVIVAKLLPDPKSYDPLMKWDFSTAKIINGGIAPSGYDYVTDIDVLLKNKNNGKYVAIMAKSSDDVYGASKNYEQIFLFEQTMQYTKVPEMQVLKNAEVFGIVDGAVYGKLNKAVYSSQVLASSKNIVHKMTPTITRIHNLSLNKLNQIEILFHTEKENNNYGMQIMRRKDDEPSFYTVSSTILGIGSDGLRHDYVYTDNKNISKGIYYYMIKQIHSLGFTTFFSDTVKIDIVMTGVEDESVLSNSFFLYQNYPNPFNPSTMIRYSIDKESFVKLIVYSSLGQEIVTLVSGMKSSGSHETTWNAQNLPTGLYFYRLEVNGKILTTKKALLVK